MTTQDKNILIIDYGMGNVCSVAKAFDKMGIPNTISSQSEDFESATHLILPGVGFFKAGMERLKELNIIAPLKKAVLERKTPLLGICLGMQLLFEKSEEGGDIDGLGVLKGRVKKFQVPDNNSLKIPHIGWNSVHSSKDMSILEGIQEHSNFYFVHSYHVHPDEELQTAQTTYGDSFVCAVQKNHIFGTQFHPEKSQTKGLKILTNFLNVPKSEGAC